MHAHTHTHARTRTHRNDYPCSLTQGPSNSLANAAPSLQLPTSEFTFAKAAKASPLGNYATIHIGKWCVPFSVALSAAHELASSGLLADLRVLLHTSTHAYSYAFVNRFDSKAKHLFSIMLCVRVIHCV